MHNLNKLLLIFLPILMLIFLLSAALSESPTFDELTHVKNGYEFLSHHDFRFDPINPPLARELMAIPVIFNKDKVLNDLTIFFPRMMSIIFTLGLGLVVYLFTKKAYGKLPALLALFLFTFEPNILANGHYAQTDLIFTFFYVASLYLFYIWKSNFTFGKIAVFGFFVGLLLSTKTSALSLFFIPVIFLHLIKYKFRITLVINFLKKKFLHFLVFFLFCLTSLWGTYFFQFDPLLGHRFDANRPAIKIAEHNNFVKFALNTPLPLGSYISSIKQVLVVNYSGLYTIDSMILGNVSHNGQPGYYFIPLIFIKTPLPLLILFFTVLILFIKKLSKDAILLIPIIFILSNVLISNLAIVYRYILSIVPLVIIYSSQIALINFKKNNFKKYLILVVLIWYLLESISSFPHYVSYVNLVLGGYKNGYRYVFDSNYDWGQGLIELKEFQRNNSNQKLQLAYFGQASPSKYGILYERLRNYHSATDNKPETKLETGKNTIVAISATCWYLCGYSNNPILKNKKPEEIVGGSILIFKF